MINLNTTKVYLQADKLTKLQPTVDKIFQEKILDRKGDGNEFMDWLTYFDDVSMTEIDAMSEKVNQWKTKGVKHLLVIGIGGSFLGAQAAIDFINGKLGGRDQVLFIGTDMSLSHYHQVETFLNDKEWAICVISKSGETLEPSLAFNYFNGLLAKKHGKNSNEYVAAVTGDKGILKTLADTMDYPTYVIPNGIGGRFSVMTPVGLFPMLFADIDVKKLLTGMHLAAKDLLNSSNLEKNSALKYAAIRFLLNQQEVTPKITHEIFTTYDYDLDMLGEWWKQLFAESEGKDGQGIFPLSVSYSRDLHSLGQIIQEGPKTFFETTLWVNDPKGEVNHIKVSANDQNLYKLNHLEGMTLSEINYRAFQGVIDAHYQEGKTSNIVITLEEKTTTSLGYLLYWYFIAVTMSGYLLEINPFNQPGVEIYKKNMNDNLSK